MVKCEVCSIELANERCLTIHLKNEHQLTRKNYVDLYFQVDSKCPFCNRERAFNHIAYMQTCNSKECVNELKRQTYMMRYGVINPGQRECQKEINRHNFDDIEVCKRRNEKTKRTSRTKYGVDSPNQAGEVKQKLRKTMRARYGVDCGFQLQKCKDNGHTESANQQRGISIKKTCLERYGVDNVRKSSEIKKRIKEIKLQRYGDPNYCNSEAIRKTMLSRYGVEHYAQTVSFAKKHRSRILFDNFYFDSKLELAFYVMCKDNNLDVEVKPTKLPFYSQGKLHYYFPDFKIADDLYECKGNHFIIRDEEGNICGLRNPYISKMKEEEKKSNQQYQLDKYNCIVKNNIHIITSDKQFIDILKKYSTDREEK